MKEFIILGLFVLTFGIFAVPKKLQYYMTLTVQILLIVLTSFIAFRSFASSEPIQISLCELFGNEVSLVTDRLSAFFIFVINITVLTGALYAKGYLKPYRHEKTKTELAWHYFNFILMHISMLMVVMLREGISFLIFWELMSASTFFLIIFESSKQKIEQPELSFLFRCILHFSF